MNRIMVLIVAITLIITACSNSKSNEEKPGLKSANDRRSTTRRTDEALQATEVDDLNELALSDTLIFTTPNTLYRWEFEASNEPEEIAADVDPGNISWSPDGSFFIYGEFQGSTLMGMRYDLASGDTTELLPVAESRFGGRIDAWGIWNWSPDGEWFLLQGNGFNRSPQLVATDGSGALIELANGTFPQVLWTDDGRAVAYSFRSQSGSTTDIPDLGAIDIYDLQTGENRDLMEEIDVDAVNAATDWGDQNNRLRAAIEEAGFSLAGPAIDPSTFTPSEYSIAYPPDLYSQEHFDVPTYCQDWAIEQNDPDSAQPTIIYEAPDANNLSGLMKLDDDSLIFLKFYFPDCEFGTPVGELLRLMPDGSIELISDELASAADSDEFRGFWSGVSRFRVSPDKSHVLWLSFDEYGLERTLNVTDLETMTSRTVTVNGEPLMDVVNMFWVEA